MASPEMRVDPGPNLGFLSFCCQETHQIAQRLLGKASLPSRVVVVEEKADSQYRKLEDFVLRSLVLAEIGEGLDGDRGRVLLVFEVVHQEIAQAKGADQFPSGMEQMTPAWCAQSRKPAMSGFIQKALRKPSSAR